MFPKAHDSFLVMYLFDLGTFHSLCWTDLGVYLCYNTPFCLRPLFATLQTDSCLLCHSSARLVNWKWLKFGLWPVCFLYFFLYYRESPSIWWSLTKVFLSSNKTLWDWCSWHRATASKQINYVLLWTYLTVYCYFTWIFVPFSDCEPWEFCNCLAGKIPGLRSGRESFPFRMET